MTTTPEQESSPLAERRRRSNARWVLLAIVAAMTIIVDQMTKEWAVNQLMQHPVRSISVIDGFLSWTYVENPGAAWGFLANANETFRRPFFFVISLIAMGFISIIFFRLDDRQWLLMAALSLVMGGAVGNFIDRLRHAYVIDFIDVDLGFYRWPTFNVADMGISVGVGMMLLDMILEHRLQKRGAPAS